MIVEQRPSLIIIIGQKTQSVDVKTHAKRATRRPTRSVRNKLNCWVLTDVLLFTHLVHLPRAYASKPDKYDGLFTFHVGRRFSHKVCDY